MENNLILAQSLFNSLGINQEFFEKSQIRTHSLLYMFYWFDRLKNNTEEQNIIKNNIQTYISQSGISFDSISSHKSFNDIISLSHHYVKNELLPVQTIDLVIEKYHSDNSLSNEKNVLLFERPYFPYGISLPGGLLDETDEDNSLNLDAKTFAALRIASEKVLYLKEEERIYKINHKDNGEIFYSVENQKGTKKIIIHPTHIYGYSIKENLQSVLRPSDPRHLVDTIGFKCELIDNENKHEIGRAHV